MPFLIGGARICDSAGDAHLPAIMKQLALSERLLKQAESTGRKGLVIEILILQALTFQGKKGAGQKPWQLWRGPLQLAQPEGYVRMFLDEGEGMTRLLCQAQSRQVREWLCI